MRVAVISSVLTASLCGALLAGCEGSVGTNAAAGAVVAAIPPVGGQAVGRAPRGGIVKRPMTVPSCSGTGTGAFVGGGFENVAGGAYSGVLEGNSNEVCDEESSVTGGYYNFISSGANTSYYSFIGSGYDNSISSNGYQSVIGGGNVNSLTAPNAVIGGGNQNTLSGADSVIAGGSQNSITGEYAAIAGGSLNQNTGEYGAIGGGYTNYVSSNVGFIGGGKDNVVSGQGGVVGGGAKNSAGGQYATVPGGMSNVASGVASFAAGMSSNAVNEGAFVWSDDATSATMLSSTASNQFLARASGGFTFWTNATNTVGATLASGSGAWASASDRAMKRDVARLDDAEVLEAVARLPISTWSYVSERGVRHVGPMAQDFYAAFRVGEDDRHITSIDEDGVALAAIKALHAENAALRARVTAMTTSQASMQRQLQRLSAAVEVLRQRE
jgi:hypothetical protein